MIAASSPIPLITSATCSRHLLDGRDQGEFTELCKFHHLFFLRPRRPAMARADASKAIGLF